MERIYYNFILLEYLLNVSFTAIPRIEPFCCYVHFLLRKRVLYIHLISLVFEKFQVKDHERYKVEEQDVP